MATPKKLEKIFAKLGAEDVAALRELIADSIKTQVADKVDLQVAGQVALYNRCEDDFEFVLDSRPYIIGAGKIVTLPTEIATFAIRKSAFKNIGRANVLKWLVPHGDPNFGIPLTYEDAGLNGDPINDYPIELGPTKYDDPRSMNRPSVHRMDAIPSRGHDEPPIQHRSGVADDAPVMARPDSL